MASPKSTAKTAPAAHAANDSGAKAATWSKSSWRGDTFNKLHIPFDYPKDRLPALKRVEDDLERFPPLVFAGETQRLKAELARVAAGEAFLFQGGDCAESFSEHDAAYIMGFLHVFLQIAVVLTTAGSAHPLGGTPIVKVGRIAGQFAKPRSSPLEKQGEISLPSYRGDIINGPEFTEVARFPDPQRLLAAYRQSAATLNFIRSLIDGGYASLTNARKWVLAFEKSPVVAEYGRIVDGLAQAFATLEPFGGIPATTRAIHHTDFWTSHEALLLGYEEALTRQDTLLGTGDWYDTSRAHGVDRRPHARPRSRLHRVLPRHRQSDRLEVRPLAQAGRADRVDRQAQPHRRAGPPDADLPVRIGQGARGPATPDRGRAEGREDGRVVVRSHARQHRLGEVRQPRVQDAALRTHRRRDQWLLRYARDRWAPIPAACMSR